MLSPLENSPYESWAYPIAQIIGGIGVVATAWMKVLPKVKKWKSTIDHRRAKVEVLRNARILRGMSLLIREWRVKYGSQRILLLHAKNGGKPWPATDKIKVSCLDQTTGNNEDNTWSRWQDWHVDPAYREMLTDLLITKETQRGLLLFTESMTDGVLKDAYRGQGTVASVLFPLTWIDGENALVYVSINFGHNIKEHSLTECDKRKYEKIARDIFNMPDEIRKMCISGRQIWNANLGL